MKKAKKSKKGLTIEGQPGETEEQAIARFTLNPAFQSANTIEAYVKSPTELDFASLIECLEKQSSYIGDGNLERIEQMLLSQAHTLDAIANNLFRRAQGQEYLSQSETFMKLGLKAQNQCRTTLEALLRAKSPKALNQTNIAHNQQINNRLGNENRQNELLEKTDGMDPGTPQEAVNSDTTLETVGKKHGTKNKNG